MKILKGPALKDLERLEHLVKPLLYRIWKNLGRPVALPGPPVPAALGYGGGGRGGQSKSDVRFFTPKFPGFVKFLSLFYMNYKHKL